MNEFVSLGMKRNRGWPWPDSSYGLSPMFGEDGWCRDCGMPLREQQGSLTLKRTGMATISGGWVPYGRYDLICLEQSLADEAAARFTLDLRPLEWRGFSPGSAQQIVIPTVGTQWFDADELRTAAIARHGSAGAQCPGCNRWRWMPIPEALLPPFRIEPPLGDVDIAASPEWFGDGWNNFREVLVRRELAELLAEASPRDFDFAEVKMASPS